MAYRRDVFRRGLKLSANLALLVTLCVSWQGDCLDTHNSSLGSSGILITASQCQYVLKSSAEWVIKLICMLNELKFVYREWQKNYRAVSGSSSLVFLKVFILSLDNCMNFIWLNHNYNSGMYPLKNTNINF